MTKRKSKLWRHWLMMPLYALAVASSAKSFRDNPVIGSPRLNQRGLHILRRELARPLGVYRRRRLESLISQADREAFARDGFIVKPNFLPPAEFKALQDEILNLDAPAREAIIGDTLTRLIPLDGKVLPRLPVAQSVLEGKRYRNLLAYVGSFRRVPHLYVQTVFSKHRPDAEPDIQSFYHSDTFHPTVKSWLFLDDVKIDSTPFTYVPGSHIANKRRLAWERRTSITAKDGKDKLTAEGSFRISEVEIRRL